jgi:hypothetical protein
VRTPTHQLAARPNPTGPQPACNYPRLTARQRHRRRSNRNSEAGAGPPPHTHPTARHYTPPPHPDKTRSGRAGRGSDEGGLVLIASATTVPHSLRAIGGASVPIPLGCSTCNSLIRRRPQPLSSCFALAPDRVRERPSDSCPSLFCFSGVARLEPLLLLSLPQSASP